MPDNYEKILNATSLDSLTPEVKGYAQLSEQWQMAVHEKLPKILEAVASNKSEPELDSHSVTSSGVEYRVYGVIHGWTGAGSGDYRSMINRALSKEDSVIYEKMLGRIYQGRGAVETPDFCVLRWFGQFALSFRLLIIWPLFMLVAFRDIIIELISRHEKKSENHIDDITYHQLDPELRRGLDGSLPTRLQVEYEMKYWGKLKGVLDSYLLFCVVPRSAYIAEFARNWSSLIGAKKLAIVVGDRHLTEVLYFLEHGVGQGWIERAAKTHAARIFRNRWYYILLFGRYFFFLLIGGFLGILPWMAAYVAYNFYYG